MALVICCSAVQDGRPRRHGQAAPADAALVLLLLQDVRQEAEDHFWRTAGRPLSCRCAGERNNWPGKHERTFR